MKKSLSVVFFIVFSMLILGLVSHAQDPYKVPPRDIVDIVMAPPPPSAYLSLSGEMMLLAEYEAMPYLSYLTQPLLRLAGTRITPRYNSRQLTTFYTGLTIKNIKDGKAQIITLPAEARIGSLRWSLDSSWIAFSLYTESGVELWTVKAETGEVRAITKPVINAVLNSGFSWLPENKLLIYTIVHDRGAPPIKLEVPTGPNVQETSGKLSKVWTYQDLLGDPHDEALFEYYATSQILEIDVASGRNRAIGNPGLYLSAEPSPDGKLFLVYQIKRPFSYSVPYSSFSHTYEIWDRDGNLVHLFADLPVADEVPVRGVPTGPRSVEWRPLKPATLIWVEALDDGIPEKQVPHRDRLMTLAAPFKENPREIIRITHRYSGLDWLKPAGKVMLTEFDWKKRWETTYLLNIDNPAEPAKKIFDLSSQDSYNNPGNPVRTTTARGESIVIQDEDWIYLSGRGASPRGDFPFLDKFNLKTQEKQRLFQSRDKTHETFIDFVGTSRNQFITRYESTTEPPNYYIVDLKRNRRKELTKYKDPAPQLTGMQKQLIKYTRNDGVELSGTLYLPPGYRQGERLPLVIWAYPIEYSDPSVAGQVRGSQYRFTFFNGTSQLFFATQGYAVLDGAQMPVVGDPNTMNNTFVEQIVSSAKAAIDKLDAMGIIDPKRVGVGGHSYGAFMTTNLLAHCDLFSAGIARSGAYNRTLTPFGFQNERRTLWEALDTYIKVSPFMHADKINEPILLIHGEDDNNSGTFPIQSQRLFHALKGLGATARLIMLPYESHGYRAKESVFHVLAEMLEWFDKYVKNKK